jgi:putative DNA methylase
LFALIQLLRAKHTYPALSIRHYVPDEAAIQLRLAQVCQETGLTIPNEPIFSGDTRAFFTHLYGLDNFGKLFTHRQLLALMTWVKWVRLAHEKMMQQGYEEEFGKAITTYLARAVDRAADFGSTLCTWNYTGGRGTLHTFSRQALPMVWDFAESDPFNPLGANYKAGIEAISITIKLCALGQSPSVERASAMNLPYPVGLMDAVITDPPYFDSVPYADLSDFFYVWLKRSIGHLYPEHFPGQLTPKKNEAIMNPSRYGGNRPKAAKAYEEMMHQAFCEASRVLKIGGMMVVGLCSQNYIWLGNSD